MYVDKSSSSILVSRRILTIGIFPAAISRSIVLRDTLTRLAASGIDRRAIYSPPNVKRRFAPPRRRRIRSHQSLDSKRDNLFAHLSNLRNLPSIPFSEILVRLDKNAKISVVRFANPADRLAMLRCSDGRFE